MNTTIPERFKIFDRTALRIIALVTMFIDHFAAVVLYWGILYPNAPIAEGTSLYTIYIIYNICRNIGRIAFPIFCFQLVEGFIHTSNRLNYMMRLTIFAVISEIPFNLAISNQPFYTESCNVFFTLLIGFLIIWAMDTIQNMTFFSKWGLDSLTPRVLLMFLPAFAGGYLTYYIQCDYDYRGIILIVVLYLFRYYRLLQAFAGALSLYWEWPAMFAFIPICLYNGKKGRNIKYFSYLFYPTHLLLLYLIMKCIVFLISA